VLRRSAEVAGNVTTRDGRVLGPQGQMTVFRLQPGAHVLPHVGVTNQRLVMQFPLSGWEGVRFRVGDEWRTYHRGSAMVFDDSFEHEVVHEGSAPRVVLYAVLHHPELGTPIIGG
jgi:aspartate beta-hydroxylase